MRINQRYNDEFRDMRSNLIFYGIAEEPTELARRFCDSDDDDKTEVSTCLIKEFAKDTLKLDPSQRNFERVHRLGDPAKAKQPSPIIAWFHLFPQREDVRKKACAHSRFTCEVSSS